MRYSALILASLLYAMCIPAWANPMQQGNTPNALAPAGVKVPAKGLSLVADYGNVKTEKLTGATQRYINVYLINATNKAIELDTQDSDPYMKLHAKDAQGNWQRAELHRQSFCGNSFYTRVLKPNSFITLRHNTGFEYQGSTGSAANRPNHSSTIREVRFEIRNRDLDIVSNNGHLTVSNAEMEAIRYDNLSLSQANLDFLIAIGEGNYPKRNVNPRTVEHFALRSIAHDRFSKTEQNRAFTQILKSRPDLEKLINDLRDQ